MRLSAPIFRLKKQAKALTREGDLPLHKTLDQIARAEGFQSWSHLSAVLSENRPASRLFQQLVAGDLVLLGARPGHGKTLLGLELANEAIKAGWRSFFFTLEYTELDVLQRLQSLEIEPSAIEKDFQLDTSEAICADYVIEQLSGVKTSSFIVIDYLQLLDQKRQNPELAEQVAALRQYAVSTGAIVVLISQIDRSFELASKALPDLSNIRLPNPLDLGLFSKACFLHEGEMRLEKVH